MAFDNTDLYLASGTALINNVWQETVHKHDTSSFYNWEQDNLPIYDLEDRTDLLWTKFGYPVQDGFSGIPGTCMVVSADAFSDGFGPLSSLAASIESSGNIYKTVSAAIASLPSVISYPIILEVASFGALGELNLNGIQFVDNGGLEIINRAFSKIYSASANVSGIGTSILLESEDVKNTINDTISICNGASLTSGSGDVRWNDSASVFLSRLPYDTVGATVTQTEDTYCYIATNPATTFDHGDNTFTFEKYSDATSDPSSLHGTTGDFLQRSVTASGVVGMLYGNFFTNVNVNQCDANGRLFLRNLCVDSSHTKNSGFSINRSGVMLENCTAARNNLAGFDFRNSYVWLSRGTIAHRNYTIDSNTRTLGRGIRAENSTIEVYSNSLGSGIDLITQTSHSNVGIELNNSKILGGNSRNDADSFSLGDTDQVSFLQSLFNVEDGIRAKDSVIEYDGRIDCFNNTETGLNLVASKLEVDEFEVANNTFGIKALNSTIQYNPKGFQFPSTLSTAHFQQFVMHQNGVNLELDNSVFKGGYRYSATKSTDLPESYGRMTIYEGHGVVSGTSTNKTTKPSISTKNSEVEFIHPSIKTPTDTGNFSNTQAIYGSCIRAENSNTVIRGSKQGVSIILGTPSYNKQTNIAAIHVDGGNMSIQGPTIIGQAAVDVLADNQAKVAFEPASEDGLIWTDAWSLDDGYNHTKVELFATRACLIADKGSTIRMSDLGDIHGTWPDSQTSATDYNLANEYDTSAYTANGYMQFYPNGQDADAINVSSNRHTLTANGEVLPEGTTLATAHLMVPYNANEAGIRTFSNGGMCVRAIGGSNIEVNNVHFPAGWYNPSAFVYSTSAGECEELRIWNIADSSRLHVANVSVSSNYPNQAGYYGPYSHYESSPGVAASAAPDWVPDTSSASVLDDYGADPGSGDFTNYGAFRIFCSPKGPAKFLFYTNSFGDVLTYGAPYQAWAQGYNPSGPTSAMAPVSSIYKTYDGQNVGGASSFFTTSAMLDESHANNIRLDESAADMFANAKNGARKISGRIPIVTIYRSRAELAGEGYGTTTGVGKGFYSANIFDLKRIN